uniref:Uncharacterized protein n=1 Tax=Plectus sambesii TaxID=2011161 RepID=A0A914VZJ8_9BILA
MATLLLKLMAFALGVDFLNNAAACSSKPNDITQASVLVTTTVPWNASYSSVGKEFALGLIQAPIRIALLNRQNDNNLRVDDFIINVYENYDLVEGFVILNKTVDRQYITDLYTSAFAGMNFTLLYSVA